MNKIIRLATITMLGLFSTNVRAEEETKSDKAQLSFFENLDAGFGKYFVGPLASVMFYDVSFWDNTLPKGEGVGQVINDRKIIGYENGAYISVPQFEIPIEDVIVILDEKVTKESKNLKWSMKSDDSDMSKIMIEITTTELPSLDIALTPIAEWKGAVPESLVKVDQAERFVTEELTQEGIPVFIDRPNDRNEEEKLPPYTILASQYSVERSLILGDEKPEEGGSVAYQKDGKWQKAKVVSFETQKTTRFVNEGEGFVRKDNQQKMAVLEGVTQTRSKEVLANPKNLSLPIVVLWLVLGAVFFTLRMNFINIRGFVHAIRVVKGDFDEPNHETLEGEVSHFQALSSALSATVGLGNIAGVAIAVSVGGPGAIFWMVVAGFLGMSSKFTECSLGQMYRRKDGCGTTLGGPMCYLNSGLTKLNMGVIGKPLAMLFALMCIGGSFGGGNMFQANQSFVAVSELFPVLADNSYGSLVYGVVLAGLTGIVILGGIKSIGKVAEIIVPVMCGIYLLAGGYILLHHAANVPDAFGVIFSEAFAADSAFGGMIGALIQGFRRAAFSNEAGVGSASIAHSAAATDEPISEGIVALLEPFIDTIVVCTMTGLVVVLTGAYLDTSLDGVQMTSAAFGSVLSWFPMVLSLAVFFFAFSTMISWSYYGERCATFLFGDKASTPYKVIFLFFVIMGSTIKLGNVLDFSDLMILGMAFPNIFGLFLLSGQVKTRLDEYWNRVQSGELSSNSKNH